MVAGLGPRIWPASAADPPSLPPEAARIATFAGETLLSTSCHTALLSNGQCCGSRRSATSMSAHHGTFRMSLAPLLPTQNVEEPDDSKLRARLDDEQLEYVLSISPTTTVLDADTRFETPLAKPGAGRPPSVPKADRKHAQFKALARSLPAKAWQPVTYRDRDGKPVRSRSAFVRVIAARPLTEHRLAPRDEWLIIKWPKREDEPTDYWLSNLPADTGHERLARLARLRWMIELDYRQLKGELGLDHTKAAATSASITTARSYSPRTGS
jgi:hypothetical protein